MTPDEYEKLPLEEKKRYAECSECGEIFDRRSLDEVLFHHADHKHPPDIQYSWSSCKLAGSKRERRVPLRHATSHYSDPEEGTMKHLR